MCSLHLLIESSMIITHSLPRVLCRGANIVPPVQKLASYKSLFNVTPTKKYKIKKRKKREIKKIFFFVSFLIFFFSFDPILIIHPSVLVLNSNIGFSSLRGIE
uniref:Uncharacterized protein n=1 Tax=Cacopsylla melanoneura TaxID=428564 RepID=A0A8D8T8X3_9HEMI